jgi:hypothetical protein
MFLSSKIIAEFSAQLNMFKVKFFFLLAMLSIPDIPLSANASVYLVIKPRGLAASWCSPYYTNLSFLVNIKY